MWNGDAVFFVGLGLAFGAASGLIRDHGDPEPGAMFFEAFSIAADDSFEDELLGFRVLNAG